MTTTKLSPQITALKTLQALDFQMEFNRYFISRKYTGEEIPEIWEYFLGNFDGIETDNVCPPIPTRKFDWEAFRDGYDLGDITGSGPTEIEAVLNLIEQEFELIYWT